MKLFASLILVVALCSCQSLKNIGNQATTLATPENVQKVVSQGGAAIIGSVTDHDKAVLHRVAVTLLALTSATVDESAINGLVTYIPQLGNPYAKIVVNNALLVLNMALTSFGSHNAKILAYTNAVGNGLISAGF
jgi:hypothetical protein